MSKKPTGKARPPKARTSGQSSSPADARDAAAETLKSAQLARDSREPGKEMSGNQGVLISDDQNSLKAGVRGPTLLEDFHLREKITHFDHERIPERVVHARGVAAHGVFQIYEDLSDLTKAGVLTDLSRETPVFVRFSTVAGSRGSTDCARDVRGFAVKFYTEEGVWDLVGNNMPVFFIQDAIKFPDLIHAVKPEPNNEIPQAASAHDTFWDFVSSPPKAPTC
jgi:catalase